ncbi:hypothetical protein CLSA_c06780 [Clostridium saccharobutylicum DSM 13864]|uniref:Uncharacterized protein n=1 Tax=Clostridium saccharobutylicum DSM 13864 TaxID=1345695 RepID=U5MPS1_CLOSA|nr:hypothetical protein CLSA_c06780 [Clostridium saccharobutylicum DSM 13864]
MLHIRTFMPDGLVIFRLCLKYIITEIEFISILEIKNIFV